MRYSYGISDRGRILLYKPQLFLSGDDFLVFPSQDFLRWHGDIKEYIDGLYQINSASICENRSISIPDLNLAIGVLENITEELELFFSNDGVHDLPYQYVSTLDKRYKRGRMSYSSDMRRCDIRIPVRPELTPWLKYKNMMEIVEEAWKRFELEKRKKQTDMWQDRTPSTK